MPGHTSWSMNNARKLIFILNHGNTFLFVVTMENIFHLQMVLFGCLSGSLIIWLQSGVDIYCDNMVWYFPFLLIPFGERVSYFKVVYELILCGKIEYKTHLVK